MADFSRCSWIETPQRMWAAARSQPAYDHSAIAAEPLRIQAEGQADCCRPRIAFRHQACRPTVVSLALPPARKASMSATAAIGTPPTMPKAGLPVSPPC
jgi:hypothetical protein